jgi:Na+-transporting NADH:ubiquinone oxidoreductase subunit NqrD
MSLAFLEDDMPWLFFAVWFLPPSLRCFVDMSVYTVSVIVLGKALKAFRFDPLLFSGFEGVVDRSGR